ncbi:MAG: NADH-quinone oxidoreductase subunit M [Cyanobacteria bacterium]|nr:NADH-quinone oxidoreductase subunit M [Cyanobacteriota bacterium]
MLGALLLGLWPGGWQGGRARQFAAIVQGVSLVWVVIVGCQFDIHVPGMQFVESFAWVEPLGLDYQLGVDGLALPLLFINSLLGLISVWASPARILRPRLYFALMLVISGAVAGAFVAQNLLLFFIFYELELIPLYLLIAIWGGTRRAYAATKFLIYTAVSGILILGSFLGVVWLGGGSSFNYDPTLTASIDLLPQLILLGALLVGFGIKIPLFPFHTWLPDAHVEASTPVSVLLAGVLLKLGTYGLVRFGLQLLPDAWEVLSPWLAGWAVVSVLYGSLAAIAQTDMKKMVAYSSIGHMGYILLAAAAATPLSVLGTVMQMVSHGLISGLLFLLVGLVYSKTGTRDMTVLRGLLNPERGLPVVGTLMILGVMASGGIPGMVGFVSELVVFRGSIVVFPVQTLLSMIGTALTAVYFLLLVNRVFFGRLAITLPTDVIQPDLILPPVSWAERWPSIVLAVVIVALGIQPSWLSRWSETASLTWRSPTVTVAQAVPDSLCEAFATPTCLP